tara:strand:+ start:798 stop:1328 length:531 start_codon:yes stop_codon:yes gene_type:complete
MAQRGVKLRAVLQWAKVFEENRDRTGYKKTPQSEGSYESCNGACTVDIIMDNDNVELLKSIGWGRAFKSDPEGRGMMTKVIRKFDTGHEWQGGAPEVKNGKTGKPWTFEDGELGNGTIADVYVIVYDTDVGPGSRLDRIDVLDHVPHEGIATKTVYKSVSPSTTPAAPAVEDEIPF